MKLGQLTCIVAALTAMIVMAIFQIAAMRPVGAPPKAVVAAEVGRARFDAVAEAAFNPAPLNSTTATFHPTAAPKKIAAEAPARRAAPPTNTTIVKATFHTAAPRRISAAFAALSPNALVAAAFNAAIPAAEAAPEVTGSLGPGRVLAYADDRVPAPPQAIITLPEDGSPAAVGSVAWAKSELPYVKYYVDDEIPPPMKPADIALLAFSNVPLGTPLEEIKHAADAFGLDFNFLKTVAKIESDFQPKERTGSYIGLFQLSKYEFAKYGSGDITDARDNAIAAANKFVNEAAFFAFATHKQATASYLYLIHQQGWQGAAEHVSHPDWVAWRSMCATSEGIAKGAHWCKRAIWGNTLPATKHEWKSVDRLTSGAFVAMWRDRVNSLYARYADATSTVAQAQPAPTAAQP